MAVQKNGPVVTVVVVAAGSLIGAGFALAFTGPGWVGFGLCGLCPLGYLVRNCAMVAVGAVLGGLLFSGASKR